VELVAWALVASRAMKECRMKHLARLTALALAIGPAAALAQVQTYYHAGAWDAFSGRSETGGAICGVGNTNAVTNGRLAIRFEIGGADTVLSASKPEWSVPANTRVTVVMQVGLNTPWTLQANGQERSIDWRLDRNAMQVFDRQFRNAASMTLTFPDGNEPPWTVSLAGSSVISDTFGRCIRDLTRQVQSAPPPSSPTSSATQPFSPAPASAPDAAPPPR
jgi:hypothetical protein